MKRWWIITALALAGFFAMGVVVNLYGGKFEPTLVVLVVVAAAFTGRKLREQRPVKGFKNKGRRGL